MIIEEDVSLTTTDTNLLRQYLEFQAYLKNVNFPIITAQQQPRQRYFTNSPLQVGNINDVVIIDYLNLI